MNSLIFYNGAKGALGSHLGPLLADSGVPGVALGTRLEHSEKLADELLPHLKNSKMASATLVQLAALTNVAACEKDPAGTRRVNVDENMAYVRAFAAACDRAGKIPHVVFASTSHVYAVAPPGTRLLESSPLIPRSVYARSKLEAETQLTDWAHAENVSLRIARIFGTLAPRQAEHFVLPGLIRRAKENRLTEIPGLEFARDFLDVRDVVWCLTAMAEDTAPGIEIMNVCGGEPVKIRDLLAEVLTCMGRPADIARATMGAGRPDDVPWIVGDPTNFSTRYGFPPSQIGWKFTVKEAVQ